MHPLLNESRCSIDRSNASFPHTLNRDNISSGSASRKMQVTHNNHTHIHACTHSKVHTHTKGSKGSSSTRSPHKLNRGRIGSFRAGVRATETHSMVAVVQKEQ